MGLAFFLVELYLSEHFTRSPEQGRQGVVTWCLPYIVNDQTLGRHPYHNCVTLAWSSGLLAIAPTP